MIDSSKLPDFLQDMPEERLKEIMEADNNSGNFDKAMIRCSMQTRRKAKRKARTKSCLAISLRFCVLD